MFHGWSLTSSPLSQPRPVRSDCHQNPLGIPRQFGKSLHLIRIIHYWLLTPSLTLPAVVRTAKAVVD